MSDSSTLDGQEQQSKPAPSQSSAQNQKRKASAAGLDGASGPAHGRSVKRRASKACQCCRARKVRCNVTEHGAPCTNCRLDEVECIVSESRRKKKWTKDDEGPVDANNVSSANRKLASRGNALDSLQMRASASRRSHDFTDIRRDEHVPHSIYQTHGRRLTMSGFQPLNRRLSMTTGSPSAFPFLGGSPLAEARQQFFSHIAPPSLPYFIKPLPPRIGPDEVAYLEKKGALAVPAVGLRNELLRAYIEFVHPFMPLLDLYDFVMIVESGNGTLGRISLILFQAVMFAGSAFCDMEHLRNAGYMSRKEARKDFFQKTRLLYDFDYEQDRVSLVQALLLLTYYYETPDDQKDTWHWMGVATSVAHTIGLHRNPDKSNMDSKRTKLWKRIWWSTYMRDRLIALGMRRPTRIKTEDYDVPMLTLDDFEFVSIPDSVTCVPSDTLLARNMDHQRQMAIMCIEKAKLCLCISHVLSKQYCVLNNNQGMVNDRTTMMLLPKKSDPETCEVKACDDELQQWLDELPEEARYQEEFTGNPAIDLNRALLHMVFFTTLSALHRPQVLPSAPSAGPQSEANAELLEVSRRSVRRAASAITSMAQSLDNHSLVRYLPTTGVTVLLPAIIIHLLDIKSSEEETRRNSLRGFCQCMQVMGKLRDIYAAADYSTAFLEAAIRKAGIQIAAPPEPYVNPTTLNHGLPVSPETDSSQTVSGVEALVNAGRRMEMHESSQSPPDPTPNIASITIPRTITPPPDVSSGDMNVQNGIVTDEEVARRLETFLASTPPDSDHSSGASETNSTIIVGGSGYNPAKDIIAAASLADQEAKMQVSAAMQQSHNLTGSLDFSNDTLFPMWQNNIPDFDENDFDNLLNMDAVGEAFSFEGGLEAAVKLQDAGLGGGLTGEGWNLGMGASASAV
ncbi:hypothetical protein NA57DRAFT_49024 [Rhizodiscina lignyota]|uniref:Zn(2)-C6 fungal-type domain-containing protein n=1 Tax=Rhizodiscina lignyota TaxID=1504668 RepID=A0A9P4I162_9PEZI|nr:hypothetical protein NA57DRAFT_49024 [Rhizodiscina lignyota]